MIVSNQNLEGISVINVANCQETSVLTPNFLVFIPNSGETTVMDSDLVSPVLQYKITLFVPLFSSCSFYFEAFTTVLAYVFSWASFLLSFHPHVVQPPLEAEFWTSCAQNMSLSVSLVASSFLLCARQATSREAEKFCFQLQCFMPQWHLAAAVTAILLQSVQSWFGAGQLRWTF